VGGHRDLDRPDGRPRDGVRPVADVRGQDRAVRTGLSPPSHTKVTRPEGSGWPLNRTWPVTVPLTAIYSPSGWPKLCSMRTVSRAAGPRAKGMGPACRAAAHRRAGPMPRCPSHRQAGRGAPPP
jgi:hypothetical protein